jgi:AcrR family transcriptional regulator
LKQFDVHDHERCSAVPTIGAVPRTAGVRARLRAELTSEIKDAARAELGVAGSAGLSLRAVARRLDLVPSALYRYFDSRDALLTALIVDAYAALAAAAAQADATARLPSRRWLAVGHAVRDWAVAHPDEWALVYGSPVPGYEAPQSTVEVGVGVVQVMAGILRDAALAAAENGDRPARPVVPRIGRDLHRWLALVREPYLRDLPDEQVALAVLAFTQVIGSVSLELFGQFGRDATPAAAMFDQGLRVSGALLGLGGP